jgi:hypothetical protein
MRACSCAIALGLVWPSLALGQEVEAWEPWADSAVQAPRAQVAPVRSAEPAGVEDAPSVETGPGVVETEPVEDSGPHVLHFGAGASFLAPIRPDDRAADHRWMSEISIRWAPFGLIGELGLDVALGRDQVFLIRPNLKFFFVKGWWFSMFLDGGCSILSHPGGTEVGGSASLGLVIGLHEHIALEIAGTASLFGLDDPAAAAFVGAAVAGEDRARRLVVFPGASARLMARF